jgi:hypothetical protein
MNEQRPIRLPPGVRTEQEIYGAVDEAILRLAREGLIVDTGRRRWSERTRSYQIVWAAVPVPAVRGRS